VFKDIEGHIGLDGRYYCLDSARLFPPIATELAQPYKQMYLLKKKKKKKKKINHLF
jgi:hypothetical protein